MRKLKYFFEVKIYENFVCFSYSNSFFMVDTLNSMVRNRLHEYTNRKKGLVDLSIFIFIFIPRNFIFYSRKFESKHSYIICIVNLNNI